MYVLRCKKNYCQKAAIRHFPPKTREDIGQNALTIKYSELKLHLRTKYGLEDLGMPVALEQLSTWQVFTEVVHALQRAGDKPVQHHLVGCTKL